MATNIIYKLDDRTGPLVEVRRWVDDNVSHTHFGNTPIQTIIINFS